MERICLKASTSAYIVHTPNYKKGVPGLNEPLLNPELSNYLAYVEKELQHKLKVMNEARDHLAQGDEIQFNDGPIMAMDTGKGYNIKLVLEKAWDRLAMGDGIRFNDGPIMARDIADYTGIGYDLKLDSELQAIFLKALDNMAKADKELQAILLKALDDGIEKGKANMDDFKKESDRIKASIPLAKEYEAKVYKQLKELSWK